MLRRTAAEKAGLFDEAYFMYSEEEDLCRSVRALGLGVYYVPSAEVIHYKGQSSKECASESYAHFWRSKIHYLKKYYPASSLRIFKWCFGGLIRTKMFVGISSKDGYHREILKALETL
jgi:GT2 family glycosyltransferase